MWCLQIVQSINMPVFLHPVAVAHTPFKEKFAIPRQPLLAPAAKGRIQLLPPYDQPEALQGLEQVSHVWLIFQFHKALPSQDSEPSLRVRPPRLGGNKKIGVFASRSTHRPNSLGQSLVKLESIEGSCLRVSGLDLLDGTPIIDIKPYVPYADSLPEAVNHIAEQAPAFISILWSEQALQQAQVHAQRLGDDVQGLIQQCLQQDPKPAYQKPTPDRCYGVKLWDLNVQWHYPEAGVIKVLSVQQLAG